MLLLDIKKTVCSTYGLNYSVFKGNQQGLKFRVYFKLELEAFNKVNKMCVGLLCSEIRCEGMLLSTSIRI